MPKHDCSHTLDLTEIQRLENEHQPPLYAKREIALVRGEGPYLFDSDGRKYLDAMSNYGVAILGHADPEYAAALSEQLQHPCHRSPELLQRRPGRAAPRNRARSRRPGLTRYFLSNSGAEAIEAAIKFARVATGPPQSRRGQARLSRPHPWRPGRDRGPEVPGAVRAAGTTATHVSFNDVDALEAAVDDQTAAILLEPIQGEGGIWPASPEYLQAAREIASAQRSAAHRRRDPDRVPHRRPVGDQRVRRDSRTSWSPQRRSPTDSRSV